MKCILVLLMLPFCSIAQQPTFFLNEGLLNDNALFIESKNWLVCYPNNGGGIIVVGDRISIWDIANGSIIKNISIGNEFVMDVVASLNERYLTIKYRGRYDIYRLDSFQLVTTISRNPDYESFLYISETANQAFFSDSAVTKIYDLAKPAAIAKRMKTLMGYYDWASEKIVNDSILINSNDTVEALSLATEQRKIVMTKKDIGLALKNETSDFTLNWHINLGSKILIKIEEYNKPSVLALYDPATKTISASLTIPFKDDYYHLSEDKKHLLIFSDHYTKESFENGYKFLSVKIDKSELKDTLIHFPGLNSMNDFSVAYEKWKYGIYTLYDHPSKFVYIFDSKTNKQFVLKKSSTLPKVNILSDNIVLYQTEQLDTTLLFYLPVGKEYRIDNTYKRVYTLSNETKKNTFQFYTKENNQYNFYQWKDIKSYERIFSFSSFSLKVIPNIINKIAGIVRCELSFPGESLDESFTLNSSIYKSRSTELEFDLNSGHIALTTRPNGLNAPLDFMQPVSGKNVYCRAVQSAERNTFGTYSVDSVAFFDKIHNQPVATMESDSFTQMTSIYAIGIGNMELTNDNKRLLICGIGGTDISQLAVKNKHLELINTIKKESYYSNKYGYCNQNKNIYQAWNDTLFLYDAFTGKLLKKLAGKFENNSLSNVGTGYIIVDQNKRNIELGNIDQSDKKIFPWKNQQWIFNDMRVGASKFDNVAYSYEATGDLIFYNLGLRKELLHVKVPFIVPGDFIDSSNFLYFGTNSIPTLFNYRTKTSKVFQTNLTIGPLSSFYHSTEDQLLFSFSTNNLFVWDLNNKKLKYNLIIADTAHYFIQNNDGYYTYDKIELNQVKCRLQNQIIVPQELDFVYNRPDLFASDTVSSKFLHMLYLKRLQQNNINIYSLSARDINYRVRCEIVNEDNSTNIVSKPVYNLHVLTKSTIPITKLSVYINGVPVFDQITKSNGIKDTSLNLTLEKGENKIVAYYVDVNGVKSNYAEKILFYEPKIPESEPQTYFVGLGIGKYADSRMNLKYAKIDILGLDSCFKRKIGNSYHSLVFTDSLVTVANLSVIRQWLLNTHPQDRVIIALSGHGLIDDSLNFYFATYNTTVQKPSAGISYNELENLFDGVQARKRLLFVDACHSGVIDNITQKRTAQIDKPTTLKETLVIAKENTFNQIRTGGVGLQESFELMRSVFADINLGKGILVLAAARGSQVANEGDEWNNGAFTYCIKEGMKGLADLNGDGLVSVSELSSYITAKVPEITAGNQIPSLNTEPPGNDWTIW